jgi:hypothetical protein
MSNMMTLNALPDPRSQFESLQRALKEKNDRIVELEGELARERAQRSAMETGVGELRRTLGPLYNALQLVYGHIDAVAPPSAAGEHPTASTKHSAVWESWKAKLGGTAAKVIDVLLLHGELSQPQIMIHIGTSRKNTVYDVVHKMNKAGIISKNGGKIRLKELANQ